MNDMISLLLGKPYSINGGIFIVPADQIKKSLNRTIPFLCAQLAEIYSSFFVADKATKQQGVITPFWNFSSQSVDKERVEKYKYVFLAKNLYVKLYDAFQEEGYEIVKETPYPTVDKNAFCPLSFYAGTSFIFVPR